MLTLLSDDFNHSTFRAKKVVIKVFDKLTGGSRDRDRVYKDKDEFIELQLRPGDAYEMNGVGS